MSREELFTKWYKARDEQLLRVKYPLNSNSLVLDIGAYKGVWAKQINELYGCQVICFEPVKSMFEQLKQNIGDNKNIKAYNVAISDKNGTEDICLKKDASSLYEKGSSYETVETKTLKTAMLDYKISCADLVKMNIEGSEYAVLEHMIANKPEGMGAFDYFKHIQIQFHMNVPSYKERRQAIQDELRKTHKKDYDYEFIWESWSKK